MVNSRTRMSRRRFGMMSTGAVAGAALGAGCMSAAGGAVASEPHLTARPVAGAITSLKSGALGLADGGRDGVLQIPAAAADRPVPLLIFLHGATQSGAGMLRRIGAA